MKHKVEILSDTDYARLEMTVNRFLDTLHKNKNGVFGVKYSTNSLDKDITKHSVMIHYSVEE